MTNQLVVHADGAITPSAAGAGVLISDGRGHVIALANRPLPQLTNNEAEYAALVLGLETVIRLGPGAVEVRMDSEVVIFQMAGRFAVNSARLKPWHRKACALARAVPRLTYTHIPRDENALADALASEAAAGREWLLERH